MRSPVWTGSVIKLILSILIHATKLHLRRLGGQVDPGKSPSTNSQNGESFSLGRKNRSRFEMLRVDRGGDCRPSPRSWRALVERCARAALQHHCNLVRAVERQIRRERTLAGLQQRCNVAAPSCHDTPGMFTRCRIADGWPGGWSRKINSPAVLNDVRSATELVLESVAAIGGRHVRVVSESQTPVP